MRETDSLNQPGFGNLVGTGIAPVSTKTAVKEQSNFYSQCSEIISEIISLHCVHPVRHAAIIFESINRHAYRIGNTSTTGASVFLMSHSNYFFS